MSTTKTLLVEHEIHSHPLYAETLNSGSSITKGDITRENTGSDYKKACTNVNNTS